MAVLFDEEKSSLIRVAPRLLQIMRVLVRHKFLGALRGKNHWPPPKEVRETFEELGLTFLKFGQVSSWLEGRADSPCGTHFCCG